MCPPGAPVRGLARIPHAAVSPASEGSGGNPQATAGIARSSTGRLGGLLPAQALVHQMKGHPRQGTPGRRLAALRLRVTKLRSSSHPGAPQMSLPVWKMQLLSFLSPGGLQPQRTCVKVKGHVVSPN